jgi:hypothetical protein
MVKLIRLKDDTYQQLTACGRWSDTMDSIVLRLLKATRENRRARRVIEQDASI